MPRLIALLRAINVGGHTVRMSALRAVFETLGYTGVETFIASGNVVFETRARNTPALEKKIEAGLKKALGYDAAVFIRSPAELAAIAAHRPFTRAEMDSADQMNILFMKTPLEAEARKKVRGLSTGSDLFKAKGREIYWLRRRTGAAYTTLPLEKVLRVLFTSRGVRTVQKMAEKYAASPPG
jgi:uncharacterized protein (DUF1697 family)